MRASHSWSVYLAFTNERGLLAQVNTAKLVPVHLPHPRSTVPSSWVYEAQYAALKDFFMCTDVPLHGRTVLLVNL